MCHITPLVPLKLMSFQVIPLLSLAIAIVGGLHLGDCKVQPLLPIWHIVAGSSGICTPFFYLLFDEVNPWLRYSIKYRLGLNEFF